MITVPNFGEHATMPESIAYAEQLAAEYPGELLAVAERAIDAAIAKGTLQSHHRTPLLRTLERDGQEAFLRNAASLAIAPRAAGAATVSPWMQRHAERDRARGATPRPIIQTTHTEPAPAPPPPPSPPTLAGLPPLPAGPPAARAAWRAAHGEEAFQAARRLETPEHMRPLVGLTGPARGAAFIRAIAPKKTK